MKTAIGSLFLAATIAGDASARKLQADGAVTPTTSTPTTTPLKVQPISAQPACEMTPAPTTPAPTTPAPITPTSPMYGYLGCYGDSTEDRVLSGTSVKGNEAMTTDLCATICEGWDYFGTEFSTECFCGLLSDDPTELGPATCEYPCAGDPSETCGHRNAISVYTTAYSYTLLGCFVDDRDNRVLSGNSVKGDPTMTTQVCAEFCGPGAAYFGTEYGEECFCGLDTDNPSELGEGTCVYDCAGDASQTCGGYELISVYTVSSAPSTPEVTYVGCFTDSNDDRIMEFRLSSSGMTNEMCEEACTGSDYYGTQYGQECWCGDASTNAALTIPSPACSFTCGGDATQYCGGFYAMSVWM